MITPIMIEKITPTCTKKRCNKLMEKVSRYYYQCPSCGKRIATGIAVNWWNQIMEVDLKTGKVKKKEK